MGRLSVLSTQKSAKSSSDLVVGAVPWPGPTSRARTRYARFLSSIPGSKDTKPIFPVFGLTSRRESIIP